MPLKQKEPLTCDRRPVPHCDRCVLNLLRPHLMQAEKDNLAYSQLQSLLRSFKQVVEQGGVIRLAIDGRIQLITPQAAQRLNRYFDYQDLSALPAPLQQWFNEQIAQQTCDHNGQPNQLPLCIEQAKQRLLIRLIPDPIGNQYLLLVEEQDRLSFSIATLELLGLTRREAEVLFWVAKDKSNVEISKVLDCCEGTVRKHLEHLYKKLEVQTRIGAVMTALKRLGILQM